MLFERRNWWSCGASHMLKPAWDGRERENGTPTRENLGSASLSVRVLASHLGRRTFLLGLPPCCGACGCFDGALC